MLTLCACGMFEIEQSTAEYRKGEKPMCAAETCKKVNAHRAYSRPWPFITHRSMAEIMREEHTRIVQRDNGAFDVIG